ncbi:ATP-dependent DNA helicase DinG [Bacillus tianshenii]|uniref:3'-5' exonuclease DinG n=1 Tax=Sutcliffiella tianshenii TaxID=1463404 RepID=A0ABS2NYJ3_9BACI|nr:exonuclease domain-containing protein [Bacillus tianshenii]MBM7619517.1 ATP-dependent DNA helicase DinG [Bacillus tianshenii]
MKQRYVVLDLETTGNSPKKQDKIIQVGAVLVEDGEITERFASFVNPSCKIPPFIEQLTSINNEMVKKAPTFAQIAPMLVEMLEGSTLVAHNVPFDLSFLQHELQESGYPAFSGNTVDTVELARILLPTRTSYKLTDLADFYQLDHDNPHRADSDAEVTAIIFLNLLEKIKSLPIQTSKKLHNLLHNMKSDIYILFHHKDDGATLSDRFHLYQEMVVLKAPSSLQIDEMAKRKEILLSQIKELIGQTHVIDEVKRLFESREHGLLEIPPTFEEEDSYLLGGILFSLENDKQVVISSHRSDTLNTIRGLFKRLHMDDRDFNMLTSSIKGKYFYLSLPRFIHALGEEEDNYDAVLTKAQILVWLTETETGDMEELSLSSGGRFLWESINCSLPSGWGGAEEATYCFYQAARRKISQSIMLLTNHSFLAKEIWKEEVLKGMHYYIIENANVFHQNVSKFLGIEISYLDIYFALSKLPDVPAVLQSKEELDDMFRILRDYCLARTKRSSTKVTYRYSVQEESGRAWSGVQEAAQRLYMSLTDVILYLDKETSRIGTASEAMHSDHFKEEQAILTEMRETFYSLLFIPKKDRLTWFEVNVRGAKNSVTIYEQPLDISTRLAEKFYQLKSSVIFVSPALSVNGSFDFVTEELGLTEFYPAMKVMNRKELNPLPGVFIPTDMPYIEKGKNDAFVSIAALQIQELLAHNGGRILVSFSSIDMLSAVYNELKNLPQSNETVVVSQSGISGGKQKILKASANFENAILLVTNSFLEEVSIKKEKIDTLVIIRLPFSALDEPLLATRINFVEKQGRNSFKDVSLPIAVLRFKKMIATFLEGQGSKNIFIFDRRVVEKRYGTQFIESIPNGIVKKDTFFSLLHSID